jgi:hypothetical protein
MTPDDDGACSSRVPLSNVIALKSAIHASFRAHSLSG